MPRKLFLNITDRYGCPVNVKGTTKTWNTKVLYITSNYDPKNWFPAVEGNADSDGWDKSIRRRIDEIHHLTEPFDFEAWALEHQPAPMEAEDEVLPPVPPTLKRCHAVAFQPLNIDSEAEETECEATDVDE